VPLEDGESLRPRLTRRAIVNAALAVADAEGLDAVSMRRVARELGVGTMSLYTHVRSKAELVGLMSEHVARDILIAEPLPEDWRSALRLIAERTRAVHLEHPWTLSAFGRVPPEGAEWARHLEQSLAALRSVDADWATKALMIVLVDDFTLGLSVHEQLAPDLIESGGIIAATHRYLGPLLRSGDLPNVARALAEGATGELPPPEERFERGLEILLDGLEAMLARQARERRGAAEADPPPRS
jgi:AcrR family transcriptional regulator